MTADPMRDALMKAKEKLMCYRAQHSGEYVGGMEYMNLMGIINAALSLPADDLRDHITDEMLTAAMRAFEKRSAVLRYGEKDGWHLNDIGGMRDALVAALSLATSAPARDSVLEEAAKVAEELFIPTDLPGISRGAGGVEVAAAIRALKGGA